MNNIGLYIHIPFCTSKCGYCGFYSDCYNPKEDSETADKYLSAIKNEISSKGETLKDYTADTIYIGGGTPSLFYGDFYSEIFSHLKNYINFAANYEATIECNLNDITSSLIDSYIKVGLNRFSIGVQSFQKECLEFIGRARLLAGKESLSVFNNYNNIELSADIIAGIKYQNRESIRKDISVLIDNGFRHISVYMLSPDTKFIKNKISTDGYDSENSALEIFSSAADYLKNNNFTHYEVSNFCLSNHHSRHNMKYWNYEQYAGFGPSANSFIRGKRFFNYADLSAYINNNGIHFSEDVRSEKQAMSEFFFSGLRLNNGLHIENFEKIFGTAIPPSINKRIKDMQNSGSIIIDNGRIKIAENNFYIMDDIIYKIVEPILE